MPRIRTIKPTFFTSLAISQLSLDTRLTFIGLWTHCDDAGRCVYEPRLIKAALWPLDDLVTPKRVAEMIEELKLFDLIQTYEVDGGQYLQVVGFQEHQRISKPQPSKLPPVPESFRTRSAPVPQLVDAGKERKGRERERKGKEEEGSAAAALTFEDEAHQAAYVAYHRASRMPDGLDAAIRAVNQPISGGEAYAWPVIGAALVEMRGASADFSPAALRGFCRRLARGEAAPSTTHGTRQARNVAAIDTWLRREDGE